MELEVHGGISHPGSLELGGVLVHKVRVLGAPRSAKVLHLQVGGVAWYDGVCVWCVCGVVMCGVVMHGGWVI